MCYFVLVFFSPFSIAITSFGEERVNISSFCTSVRFALVWVYLFPLPLGVWEGLRFVIVALPMPFSYLFFFFFFCNTFFVSNGNLFGVYKLYVSFQYDNSRYDRQGENLKQSDPGVVRSPIILFFSVVNISWIFGNSVHLDLFENRDN